MTHADLTWLLLLAGGACLGAGLALRFVGALWAALLLVGCAFALYWVAFARMGVTV